MRKSIDGLARLAHTVLQQDPLGGHLFVFVGRRRDRVKLLYWDEEREVVWYKRLKRGIFRLSAAAAGQTSVRRTKRYRRPAACAAA